MFDNYISDTALTSSDAQAFFKGRIESLGDLYLGELSLVSTLRALLYDKLEDGEKLCYRVTEYRNTQYLSSGLRDLLNQYREHYLGIYMCSHIDMSNERVIQSILNDESGFKIVRKMTTLFGGKFPCYCFINESIKSTVIIVPRLTIAKFHLLQSALVGVMPWYFGGGIDEDRKALALSLRGNTHTNYLNAIEKIARKIDMYESFLKKSLNGIEHGALLRKIKEVENEISANNSMINELTDRVGDLLGKIETLQCTLSGMYSRVNSDGESSELLEYFIANSRGVKLIHSHSGGFNFVVSGYIEYYDEELAERHISSKYSVLYSNLEDFAQSKALMRAIFIDKILKVKVCAAYDLDTDDGRAIRPLRHHPFDPELRKEHMPNPHIDEFGCVGNYAPIFMECLGKGDYIGAIEAAKASARSLNFADVTVLEFFAGRLGAGYSCIELPDGTVTDKSGAIAWLNSKKIGGKSDE